MKQNCPLHLHLLDIYNIKILKSWEDVILQGDVKIYKGDALRYETFGDISYQRQMKDL